MLLLMDGVPAEGVVVNFLHIGLQCRCRESTAADEHDDGEDEDQQGQEHDEGERAEDEAQSDRFPTKLLQVEADWR